MRTDVPIKEFQLNLRAGEIVEVRSKEEILRTLDENGRLDELPFMPDAQILWKAVQGIQES